MSVVLPRESPSLSVRLNTRGSARPRRRDAEAGRVEAGPRQKPVVRGSDSGGGGGREGIVKEKKNNIVLEMEKLRALPPTDLTRGG